MFLCRLIKNPKFDEVWATAMMQIRDRIGCLTPVCIAVFCRAGEKRSVSIAWLISNVLRRLNWTEVDATSHLCSRFWGRKTCGGTNCKECDTQSREHSRLVESLVDRTRTILEQS